MLYEKNKEESLATGLFKNPSSEYRGAPFWAWNNKLDKALLLKEIDQMKEMGMGGFHIHCRSGLETEYLGSEFMALVSACNEKAKSENMLCWLYDEDRWPSGAAGGIVTKDHRYRARFLVFQPKGYIAGTDEGNDSSAQAKHSNEKKHLATYMVRLENGKLGSYRRLAKDDNVRPSEDGAELWDAFIEVSGDTPWFNNEAYVNTLDPAAIRRFVEVTHEAYYKTLGDDFGKSVPAIFTDEPQFTHKECLNFAEDKHPVTLPFTDDFDDTYTAAYGESILDRLPELFWELPDGRVSVARYRYHDHLSERFASAFADTIGNWCGQHNIMLTGHMMEEDTLFSQTRALGDCMRSYRSFQLPGIDVLCDQRLFSTAKQAASAAHQYGRPGVLSELYGVTNWNFDFRSHKLAGDWQAALGVTMRVHHLNWVSMAGEAKRDYPASIGYQSPWYKEYSLVENHFARLNTALTRGKPRVRLGVIHPVESYWLHWGPKEQTQLVRDDLENSFKSLVDWLLYGFIDFDFISESLLPSQMPAQEGTSFNVGQMSYDAVLVPGCETLRSTTLKRLQSFRQTGGRVIFAGKPAVYVDAEESESVQTFTCKCENVEFTRGAVLEALENIRDIDIRDSSGARAGNLLYQIRQDGAKRWLFICHANKMSNSDIAYQENIVIRIAGAWLPTVYDTMTGEIHGCESAVRNNETVIHYGFYPHDSLLLQLEPLNAIKDTQKEIKSEHAIPDLNKLRRLELPQPEKIVLSEPNALVLDMAEYSLDGGDWQPREELLRIGNIVREKLGFPPQDGGFVQPWTVRDAEKAKHTLSLRFTIESDISVTGARLALENAHETEITVNGESVASEPEGWFTDESIQCVALPSLPTVRTQITLKIPFTKKTNTEWCYLLGQFGVEVAGRFSKIVAAREKIVFGDWTTQGLPFYAGNVTYICMIECEKRGRVLLEASHFRAPLLSVSADGKAKGKIAFAPYIADLGVLEKGSHTIELTAYGSRINAFGTLHNSNKNMLWVGPDAWRTTGGEWSYEYQLKQAGILVTPTLWAE